MEERIIRFHGLKFVWIAAPVFALAGISMLVDFDAWRKAPPWVHCTFAVIAIVIPAGSVFLRHRYFVRLAPEGLTIQRPTRREFYRWEEVGNFRVQSRSIDYLPAGKLIVFDLADDSPHRQAVRSIARAALGYDVSLLATFEMDAEPLAELLNGWRSRHAVRC